MSRYISLWAAIVALVTALALVPARALAVNPDVQQRHEHFTDTFSIELCGIAVEGTSVRNVNFRDYADGSIRAMGTFHTTYTAANGKSVIVSLAGQYISPPVIIDEEAGTFTIVESYEGLPLKIQTANGPNLLRDAGLITFQTILDLFTLDLISREIIVNKGPHPESESDATLFCEVITAALM